MVVKVLSVTLKAKDHDEMSAAVQQVEEFVTEVIGQHITEAIVEEV